MSSSGGAARSTLLKGSGVLVATVLAAALVVAALEVLVDIEVPFLSRGGLGDPTANALRQESPLPYSAIVSIDEDLTAREVAERGRITATATEASATLALTVQVEAPEGAQAMQLANDPMFADAVWEPISSTVDVPVWGVGDQVIFGRFRLDDTTITPTIVAGGAVDPTWAAATSADPAGDGIQRPSWVRPFSSTEIVVRVEAGRIVAGGLEAYDLNNPIEGDEIDSGGSLTSVGPFATEGAAKVVRRDGAVYGLQVSQRTDVIRRVDTVVGAPLDTEALLSQTWTISSEDSGTSTEISPSEVVHVARPADGGTDATLSSVWATVHDVVLTLPEPLQAASDYRVAGPTLAPITFTYDPAVIVSPAVRVNQNGYRSDDPLKVGYLSGWFDGIGDSALEGPATFTVVAIDDSTGERSEVLSASATRRPGDEAAASNAPGGRGDLTGSEVYELDFSSITEPGRYQVCVSEVGCSYRFAINDHVWERLTATVARALYHQRSGIELGPPFTPVVRPRPHHPADGMTVEASDYSLFEAQTATDNTDFARLADARNGATLPDAWGGHMDAGDWDRRINHLSMVTNIVHAFQAAPELANLELNIVESGDNVPDLLDEALWSLDFYRRLQRPDGAISGGIESSEHPPLNATSWTDDLALFAYEPDVWSTYRYAAAAAQTSTVLDDYDTERATQLLDSALAAMDWAEQQRQERFEELSATPGRFGTANGAATVDEQRATAAASLLLATNDSAWGDVFVESAVFIEGDDPYLSCHAHTACDAAWSYLQASPTVTDPEVRDLLVDRFRITADALVEQSNNTAYGWTTENPFVPLVWGLGMSGAPHASGLLRAYALTGDERYRATALRTAAVSLGANAQNRSLITGVGIEPVSSPQINDIRFGGLPTWPGTPVYGAHRLDAGAVGSADEGADSWVFATVLEPAGATPDARGLPYMWQWYDVDNVAPFNEFTVHQSHGEALLVFAILAYS